MDPAPPIHDLDVAALQRAKLILEEQVAALASANANAAELMAALEEKNEQLGAQALALATANANAAELMAALDESREEEERLRHRGEKLKLQSAVDAVIATIRDPAELLGAILDLLMGNAAIGLVPPVAAALWQEGAASASHLVVRPPGPSPEGFAVAAPPRAGIPASLDAPVVVTVLAKERIAGALHLGKLGAAARDRWLGFLGSIGVQLGVAIERLLAEEEILRVNRELAQARDEAMEASRAKSAFLANMSHELRTPLSAIIGYGEMLHEELAAREPALATDVVKIQSAGRHLLAVINDVLDLSKIEAGKMELVIESVAIAPVVAESVALVGPMGESAGVTISVDVAPDAGSVRADAQKLRQVLFNLLSNACKFGKGGVVAVAARREGSEVRVSVADSGIGMSPEELGRIFRPFTQADATTTRRFGGTGLGLTISQRFCQMMGGSIAVESAPGKGSRFTVTVPAEALPAPAPVLATSSGDGAVLVVDDDPATRELLTRLLAKQGIPSVAAGSGAEALRLAHATRPRLVTLDVMMPDTDGWSVLRELKGDEELRRVPVVMVSVVDDRTKAAELGADDYIVKPVDPARLMAVMRRFRSSI